MTQTDLLHQNQGFVQRQAASRSKLAEIRKEIERFEHLCNPNLVVFAAGSLGRHEYGAKSDLDLFLIHDCDGKESHLTALEEYRILGEAIRLNDEMGFPEFSNDARFLKIYSVSDLVDKTGNPLDDSENYFTARMLLLLESEWLSNQKLCCEIKNRVIDHYLRDSFGKADFRPLFLLNDLLRFWRTLCLNYEHRRNDLGKPWRKKNINLKFGRMVTVFATVLAIVTRNVQKAEDFSDMLECVPLQRLCNALSELNDSDLDQRFSRVVADYEQFLKWKESDQPEAELIGLKSKVDENAEFLSKFLHDALLHSSINPAFRRYLVL